MGIKSVSLYKKDGGFELKKIKGYLIPRFNGTLSYEIYTDSPATVLADVLFHPSLPKLYSAHPEFPGAICKKIRAPQGMDDDSYLFDVTCEYDDDFDGADKEEPEDKNPLNRPTIIHGAFSEYDEILVRDVNGVLIRNSAKDFFDPPLTRKGGALRFGMTKNYANLNIGFLKAYKNATNSDPWFGESPGAIRIASITFERIIEDVQLDKDNKVKWVYWPHTFEFEVAETGFGKDGTWRKYVENKGYRQLVGGVLQNIPGSDGIRTSQPAFLKTDGTVETNPSNVNFLAFDIYRPMPFAALNLL